MSRISYTRLAGADDEHRSAPDSADVSVLERPVEPAHHRHAQQGQRWHQHRGGPREGGRTHGQVDQHDQHGPGQGDGDGQAGHLLETGGAVATAVEHQTRPDGPLQHAGHDHVDDDRATARSAGGSRSGCRRPKPRPAPNSSSPTGSASADDRLDRASRRPPETLDASGSSAPERGSTVTPTATSASIRVAGLTAKAQKLLPHRSNRRSVTSISRSAVRAVASTSTALGSSTRSTQAAAKAGVLPNVTCRATSRRRRISGSTVRNHTSSSSRARRPNPRCRATGSCPR